MSRATLRLCGLLIYGHEQIVIALLQHPQINPNLQNEHGETTLMLATYRGHDKAITALFQHPQINPNLQNEQGETVLMWAASFGHDKIVTALLQYLQINLNLQNDQGDTALMWAANHGYKQIVIALLQYHQTNPNLTNKYGDTALTIASKKGHEEVVSIIQNHLKSRSEATISKSIYGLHEAIHGRNPVMFFNQPVPKDIIIEIAKLTGDHNVHTESQSKEIAAASLNRLSP